MDAVQFGRWLSTRRRKCGYRSQRVLVEKAHNHPLLWDMAISEDFLARLEAGQLAHPFRGRVRERVLGLAWLLCKTPRDVKFYLRTAELTELTTGEGELIHLLNEQLDQLAIQKMQHVQTALPMPPRPPRLIGRADVLHELVNTLCTTGEGLCVITGMPGVGKSALVYEAVHLVSANEGTRMRVFPGGIAAFTCTGRQGTSGLVALLHDIARAFGDPSFGVPPNPHKEGYYILEPRTEENVVTPLVEVRLGGVRLGGVRRGARYSDEADATIAQAIDRVRMALVNRAVLLLLDDVEADFPWRLALEALLGQRQTTGQPGQFGEGRAEASVAPMRRVVLATSRYVPTSALMHFHRRLSPLEPDAALELFTQLVGRSGLSAGLPTGLAAGSPAGLPVEERDSAEQICAAVGYLPLAIEIAAAAVAVEGIPLPLLAAGATLTPLDELLDGQRELRSRMTQALAPLEPEMRKQFALLSTLGVPSFGLECVAAMHTPASHTHQAFASSSAQQGCKEDSEEVIHTHIRKRDMYRLSLEPDVSISREHEQKQVQALDTVDVPLEQLARTATELGQLVRHSLLDLEPHGASIVPRSSDLLKSDSVRYRMHPVLHAQAVSYLRQLEPEIIEEARHNTQVYALSYIERHRWDATQLERERDFLFASLEQARRAEQHAQVIQFVEGLVLLTCRLCNHEEGERVIQWGIRASQELHDKKYQVYFLHDLGNFLTMSGEFNRARQAFQEALELASQLKHSNAWFPLCGLAHIAHIQGEYDTALHFSEGYLRRCRENENGDTRSLVVALNNHAFYARLNGKLDEAYADTSMGMRLLTERFTGADRLQLQVQAEFARVQGHYTQSREYIERLANIIQEKCDLYMLADTLFDQACYAQQQGQHEDVRNLAQRVIQVATHIGSPHFQSRSIQLLQQLPGA